jgi:hypothetical protein
MFGGTRKWTWLAGDDASFVATTGSRAVAVGAIALTFLTISKSNYVWFAVAAVVCGLLVLLLIARFDRLRKLHVREIPIVGADGKQARNDKGQPATVKIVIGTENDMRADAKSHYLTARKKNTSLSPIQFLGGYGSNELYSPESCWPAEVLSKISSHLTLLLMWILLLGVMALYLAASSIEVANRSA